MPRKNGITLHQVRLSLGEEVSPKKQKQAIGACFLLFVSHRMDIEHAAARNKKTSAFGAGFLGGAKDGIRTRDPDLGKVVLYQLSYFRSGATKIERKVLRTSNFNRKI